MKHSLKTGLSFGLTSGIITTVGLMVGLHSGTHSKLIIIGGILTIAIADSFSDALGIHVAEESENKHTDKEIWEATIFTFIFKFISAITFIIPLLLFELTTAVIISVAWGLLMLGIFSIYLANGQKNKTWKVVAEHLFIALTVIVLTNYIGGLINTVFNN